jgi:hypothetical protein
LDGCPGIFDHPLFCQQNTYRPHQIMPEKKDGDYLHNDFDLSCFIQASTNELPSEPSGLVAILKKACDDRTNVINASKNKIK